MRERKYFPDIIKGILLLGNTSVVSSLKKLLIIYNTEN